MTATSSSNGAEVVLEDCTGSSSQHWVFTNGQIRVFGNMCLDLPSGRTTDGTKLQIWTCSNGNVNQGWYYTVRTIFFYATCITSVNSGGIIKFLSLTIVENVWI